MDNTELALRIEALHAAKDMSNWGVTSTLIENASAIEDYLTFGIKSKDRQTPLSIIDSLKIEHPSKGLIPFKKYHHQEVLWTAINNSKSLLVNTARCMGNTTLYAVYAIYYALTFPKSKIKVISNNINTAKKLAFMFNNQTSPIAVTQQSVKFSNESVIEIENTSDKRIEFVDVLIIDNAAFIPFKDEDYINRILDAVRHKYIISSTPNLNEGLFHSLWTDESIYNDKIMLPWYVNESLDLEWAKSTEDLVGKDVFNKEYNCKFISKF